MSEPPHSSEQQAEYRRRRSRRSRTQRRKQIKRWLLHNGLDILLTLLLIGSIIMLFNPLPLFAAPGRFGAGLGFWLAYEGGIQSIGGVILAGTVLVGAMRLRQRINARRAWWARHCPNCGSSQLSRIHRNWIDRLVSRLGIPIRRFVCRDCHWRGARIDESRIRY